MSKHRKASYTIDEATQVSEHLAMMQDPRRWPRWPWLPLKRSVPTQGQFPDMGVLHADDTAAGAKPRVYRENLFAITTYFPTEAMKPASTEYDSLADMLADGWRVD